MKGKTVGPVNESRTPCPVHKGFIEDCGCRKVEPPESWQGVPKIAKRFLPIEDRVVVKVEPAETMVGSIHLPDISIEKPQFGTVMAVGPGRMEHGAMIPMTLKVGDRVCFALYAGNEVKALGEDVVIMRQCDVLGVEEES